MSVSDEQAQEEMKRWGGEFIGAMDAIREGEPDDVVKVRLLGDPDQTGGALNYRLWMMVPVGAWVAGQLLARNHPDADGGGFFGPEVADDAEPAMRAAAQLVAAAANRDDEHVLAITKAHQAEHGWRGVSEVLAGLAMIAAPFWDRKPVDL